jgi:hypothetical protein
MKRIFTLIFLLFIGLIQPGCKVVDKLTQFTMDYDESIVISSLIGINLPFNLFTPAISTNSESTFEVNETRKDLIEKIVLRKLELTLTLPQGSDFSFLKAATVFISAEGLPELEIATIDNIADNVGNFLQFSTYDTDLKDYIKKDQISLRLNTTTDELILSDQEVKVHTEFFVDARILGI